MSERYEYFELTEDNKSDWNNFVLQNSLGSIHQVSDWKTFQETIPGRSVVRGFGIKDKKSGTILSTTLCIQMDTGFRSKTWWYSPRGPVFDSKNTDAVEKLIQQTTTTLKNTKALFWRLDPYTELPNTNGIRMIPATQDYQPTNTLELDLTKSDGNLLAEMKRKGRYNIRLTEKKGVTFRSITGKEFQKLTQSKQTKLIDQFWDLNTQTTGRDGFKGHEKSYYHNFLTHLSDYAVLFFADFENTPIATAISTFCGEKAIYYFGASTSDHQYRNLMAPYGLQWHMIQHAKGRGCISYDFLGIAPENQPKHDYAGISEFKWKFGGMRKIYPQGKEIVFKPFWYGLYRFAKKIR